MTARRMTLLVMLAGAALIVAPSWSRPDIRFIEVFRGTTNVFSAAESLVVLPGTARRYPDPIGVSGAQRWYWYRLINTRGDPGASLVCRPALRAVTDPARPGRAGEQRTPGRPAPR